MKVRAGFVSNSSSVSFSIVMSYVDYQKAMMKLNDDAIYNAVVDCGEPLRQNIGGIDICQVLAETEDVSNLNGKHFRQNSQLKEFLSILQTYPCIVTKETK